MSSTNKVLTSNNWLHATDINSHQQRDELPKPFCSEVQRPVLMGDSLLLSVCNPANESTILARHECGTPYHEQISFDDWQLIGSEDSDIDLELSTELSLSTSNTLLARHVSGSVVYGPTVLIVPDGMVVHITYHSFVDHIRAPENISLISGGKTVETKSNPAAVCAIANKVFSQAANNPLKSMDATAGMTTSRAADRSPIVSHSDIYGIEKDKLDAGQPTEPKSSSKIFA